MMGGARSTFDQLASQAIARSDAALYIQALKEWRTNSTPQAEDISQMLRNTMAFAQSLRSQDGTPEEKRNLNEVANKLLVASLDLADAAKSRLTQADGNIILLELRTVNELQKSAASKNDNTTLLALVERRKMLIEQFPWQAYSQEEQLKIKSYLRSLNEQVMTIMAKQAVEPVRTVPLSSRDLIKQAEAIRDKAQAEADKVSAELKKARAPMTEKMEQERNAKAKIEAERLAQLQREQEQRKKQEADAAAAKINEDGEKQGLAIERENAAKVAHVAAQKEKRDDVAQNILSGKNYIPPPDSKSAMNSAEGVDFINEMKNMRDKIALKETQYKNSARGSKGEARFQVYREVHALLKQICEPNANPENVKKAMGELKAYITTQLNTKESREHIHLNFLKGVFNRETTMESLLSSLNNKMNNFHGFDVQQVNTQKKTADPVLQSFFNTPYWNSLQSNDALLDNVKNFKTAVVADYGKFEGFQQVLRNQTDKQALNAALVRMDAVCAKMTDQFKPLYQRVHAELSKGPYTGGGQDVLAALHNMLATVQAHPGIIYRADSEVFKSDPIFKKLDASLTVILGSEGKNMFLDQLCQIARMESLVKATKTEIDRPTRQTRFT